MLLYTRVVKYARPEGIHAVFIHMYAYIAYWLDSRARKVHC